MVTVFTQKIEITAFRERRLKRVWVIVGTIQPIQEDLLVVRFKNPASLDTEVSILKRQRPMGSRMYIVKNIDKDLRAAIDSGRLRKCFFLCDVY